jgi:hypothetical protein
VRRVLTTHRPSPGQFSTADSQPDGTLISNAWWDCRELFQDDFTKKTETILFAHKSGHYPRIRTFISIAEELLDAPASEVGPTHRKTITYIIPSDFWTQYPIRRSLFSILLRASVGFRGDFDSALYRNSYVASTRKAVERFFGGHTTYNGRKSGWCDQFRGKSTKQLQRLLS